MENSDHLKKLCQLIRFNIISSTTNAGSGHPTSSLSAVELMTVLFFGGFLRYDLKNPKNPTNDRVIFSKGHAAPLFYALCHAADIISSDELLKLRTFNSNLEGHPTPRFPYVDVATGSLGQGLSIGVGMALGMRLKLETGNSKLDKEFRSLKLENQVSNFQPQNQASSIKHLSSHPRVYVLLGDSEMAEGQIWEAMEIANHYKLNNIIAIFDVNRLGQRGETMLGWDLETYAKRAEAFGWSPIIIDDGHDINKIIASYQSVNGDKPTIIIAKTIKGKGVSFLENKNGWHGKPIPKERLQEALKELGDVNLEIRGKITLPKIQNLEFRIQNKNQNKKILNSKLIRNSKFLTLNSYATREAYGDALVSLGEAEDNIVVLDAEVSNSTFAEKFAQKFPDRFFEMFIAEQNMISTALGLSKQGFIPFCSSFAAFLTRSFDQIRMCQYSNPNLKISGSHAGVSIGPDGPSQMGLEDISMFRSILNSVVFYPSDAVSAFKMTQIMAENNGLFYLRTTREKTPIIYSHDEEFKIGGLKILKQTERDKTMVIAAGITVHEALKTYNLLKKQGTMITVVDLYCIKPIDITTIKSLLANNQSPITNIIVVEDHYPAGGIGEAILSSLGQSEIRSIKKFIHLSVNKIPRSGTPEQLLRYEEIDSEAIIKAINSLI